MDKMYDLIVSGYVSMDRVIKIKTPAKIGFTSIVSNKDNAKVYYGGCSSNIAFSLAKLGKKALPTLRIGALDKDELGFYDHFKESGVCMDAIKVVENETTSNCYLILDENRKHITIFHKGAMDDKYCYDLDKDLFEKSKYACLTIGSYADNVEFFNKCKMTNTPLIFGMKSDFEGFPVPFLKEILEYSEIIFTNEVECEEIKKLYNLDDITDLFDMGRAKIIVTTLGKKGSIFYEKTDDKIVSKKIEAYEITKPLDTTGAGDAFIAGFIFGLTSGFHTEKCCECGSILSSFIFEKVGCITNAPTIEEFIKRYELLTNKKF